MLVAGVDEVGRGPLAGPVFAAAVILDTNNLIIGLRDSKKLTAKKREALAEIIKNRALAYAFGYVNNEEIDRINILQATLLAMQIAINNLAIKPQHILIDGIHSPTNIKIPITTIIKGDAKEDCISAASIIAKVERDRKMVEYDAIYPNYGFKVHKGYPTAVHIEALKKFGPCVIHRRSFAPVNMLS